MRNMIVVAVALAFGCAMGGQETKKSQAMTAQDQAHAQLQQAADAQKRASEEQAKAEAAQRDVEHAQKALADAQAKERGQRVKAQQAQQDAQRLTQQAQQFAQEQQSQALEAQQQEASQNRQLNQDRQQKWTQEQTLRGRVISASSDELQVRSSSQGTMKLGLTDTTAIRLDGRSGSASQIQPGSDVRASYQMIDGKARALKIDVTSQPAGQSDQSSSSTQDQGSKESGSQQQQDTPK